MGHNELGILLSAEFMEMGKSLGVQSSKKKCPAETSKALGFLLCHKVKNPFWEGFWRESAHQKSSGKFFCQSQREHTIFYGSQGRAFTHVWETTKGFVGEWVPNLHCIQSKPWPLAAAVPWIRMWSQPDATTEFSSSPLQEPNWTRFPKSSSLLCLPEPHAR